MHFDLVIKGGRVVDPGAGLSGQLDVAVKRDRIAAVEAAIPAEAAHRVIDAAGQLVTPGLVDLHTHVYHGATYWGVRADPVAARTGVTTWLDVGSAGGYNFPGFREFIAKPATARIFALLNISSIGLTAPTFELANLDYCDVELCCKLVDLNRDIALGIKARIDKNTTRGTGLEPLKRARAAADRCELPLMVHVGNGPPALNDVIRLMRPNDILTHCFTGWDMRIIDDAGKLRNDVKAAWDAGIVMDIGHGAGSFSFETAEAMLAEGYLPDVISSDIHQLSIHGPLYDLPTCLSKFLALGMSFEQVIHAATARPAQVMGVQHEIGSLAPGALADIALFELDEGEFTFYDVHMNPRYGKQMIRNTLTIIGGRELPVGTYDPQAPWIELTEAQTGLVDQGHAPQSYRAGMGCC